MSDKIKTCKPSLINSRADYNYRLEYTDTTGADWEFDMHTMNARQRGAIQASLAVVKMGADNQVKTEIESNMELVNTATIMNAITGWNLDDEVTITNVDLLPKDVRAFLVAAINAHETGNDATLESEIKN